MPCFACGASYLRKIGFWQTVRSAMMTRTKKVFSALDTFCADFDLSTPIWLDTNIREFKRHSKTRFHQDNFVETIDFDYLEIQVLEEDEAF